MCGRAYKTAHIIYHYHTHLALIMKKRIPTIMSEYSPALSEIMFFRIDSVHPRSFNVIVTPNIHTQGKTPIIDSGKFENVVYFPSTGTTKSIKTLTVTDKHLLYCVLTEDVDPAILTVGILHPNKTGLITYK